jgi:lipid A 3-O-deacylase|tara:strand:+ start:35 stop:538 length:504 start_codon:yes stop_codon:yes gene_type:complete
MKIKIISSLILSLLLFGNALTEQNNKEFSFYTGEFDLLDKEGDDQTTLFGLEHRNPNLFRDTFMGKFAPVTGGFITGKSSLFIYTGVEAQYDLGPLSIVPSFTPGYYEKGNGKDLGDILEFKSEIKFGFNIFEDSSIGYSYSHISNNDWGERNPGTDNQSVSFSKKF